MQAKRKLNIKWTPARGKWRIRRGGFHVEYLPTAAEVLAKYGEEATFTLESGEVLSVPGKERVYLPEHADADLLHEMVECSHQELVNKAVLLFEQQVTLLEDTWARGNQIEAQKQELEEKDRKIQRLQDLIQGQEEEVRMVSAELPDLKKKNADLFDLNERTNNQLIYYVAKCQRLEADLEWHRNLYATTPAQEMIKKNQEQQEQRETGREKLKKGTEAAIAQQLQKISDNNDKEVPLETGFMARVMDWIARKGKARPPLMTSQAPFAPQEQDAWLDTSTNPPVLRTFNNGQWK